MLDTVQDKNISLLMKDITYVYPNGFLANDHVDLACEKGTIHALLGENGAGKTTLMKLLFGFLQLQEGSIQVNGKEVSFKNAEEAISNGIGMVHQHFMLIEDFTIAENVVLGLEETKLGLYDQNTSNEKVRQIAERFSFDLDPTRLIGDCSVGVRQKVEILKALYRGADTLILDEPTAVLTPQETAELFVELEKLKEAGHTIIFITHKLDEVKQVCDHFTILRKGKNVASGRVVDYSKQDLSTLMVGRELVDIKRQAKPQVTSAEKLLEVERVNYFNSMGKQMLKDVSFSVRAGEVVGIAAVEGNGQSELTEVITGMEKFASGDIRVMGQTICDKSIREIRNIGLAHISEDRMTYGSAPDLNLVSNVLADRYYKDVYQRGPLLNVTQMKDDATLLIRDYSVDTPSMDSNVSTLSGGNLQKLIAAREFSGDARIIVVSQPTRGIDVGSSEFIHNKILELAHEKDSAVLLVSADLTELLKLSDRIFIMYNGQIVETFDDVINISEMDLGNPMLGVFDNKEGSNE